MGRIVVLPDSIASRIAAGEVVERPASALKELIENAIDARARSIDIVLEAGGRDGITVTDDGEGMGPDDLLLALERHATSKIRTDGDIERVRTLGFRGEAVPAIASVSRFRMTSRDEQSDAATVVEVQGGRIVSVREEPAPRGTRVEAMRLFYNAPARRKFLRSADTERQHAVEMVSRFAIGYPEVRFRLASEGRLVFDHAPITDPLERCAQVLGRQLIEKLLPVRATTADLRLVGLCSDVSETRSHTRDQHLYVNRRPVRDRLLAHAVAAVYRDVLPRGRHPVVVLLIEMPPGLVDVNVHPSKAEVRFRRPGEIHDLVNAALRDVLRDAGAAPSLDPAGKEGEETFMPRWQERGGRPFALAERRLPGTSGYTYAPSALASAPDADPAPVPGVSARGTFPEPSGGRLEGPPLPDGMNGAREEIEVDPASRPRHGEAGSIAPLGQFLDSYILARDGEGLLIIDQHAAHERVLFEKIFRSTEAAGPAVQPLLSPVSIELGPAERDSALRSLEVLSLAGFEIETFGEGALLVRAIPAGLEGSDPVRLVRDVLSDLRAGDVPVAIGDRRRHVAASTACHAAIKVRFPLNIRKMGWLLEELFRCETPATCPHGRPSVLRIGREEIERGFHRR